MSEESAPTPTLASVAAPPESSNIGVEANTAAVDPERSEGAENPQVEVEASEAQPEAEPEAEPGAQPEVAAEAEAAAQPEPEAAQSVLEDELVQAIDAVGIEDDWDEEVREGRLRGGCCQNCGTQLFTTKRSGLLFKKRHEPLNIPGRVSRGQCLQCIGKSNLRAVDIDSDMSAAIALSAVDDSVPSVTLGSQTVSQMLDATYRGAHNNYGERHGLGELFWSNGDKYNGNFANGKRNGQGTLLFSDGSDYVGDWRHDQMHGQGTRRFADGNVYNGQYREGHRSGPGRCYFSNGDMYVGEWRNDQMTGFGRYYYSNGQSFEGFFWEGRRTGRGKYQLTDGRMDIYRYENDKRVGEGVRWSANRKRAWRMLDGKQKGRISAEEAGRITTLLGSGNA